MSAKPKLRVIDDEHGWTPILNGKFYCSPRCGGGRFCLKADHDQAVKDAAALAKRLGSGWEPHVWENLGWHYEVTKGVARVMPHVERRLGRPNKVTGYWCSIMTAKQFTADAETPEDALGFALQDARGAERKIASDCNALMD